MADPLDPEQTQEENVSTPAPEPTQTPQSLDQFLYGDQPQQAQPTGGLDDFLYGNKQEQDAINQKIPVAQHIMALRDDPAAIDPISAIARKIQEPSKGEAAWADYNNSIATPDYEQLDAFKDAESKNEWGKMAKIGIQMIGKDWGNYISAMLGLTDEDRKKNQESFGAQMAIGKITDPKDAATALQLQENFEKDLQAGKSIAPEGQKPAMSFGTGQLSLKLGMNLAEADEYYKKLKDERTKAFGEAALRNFAVQSGDAFIPFVSVGDIIVDEKNPDQVARRAALAKAINQTISDDYFLGTVAGQAAGSLGSFMAAGALSTKILGRAAQVANAEVKVPSVLSQGTMYGVMGTSQSVKADTRNLSPTERLASIFSESLVLGLSEKGGDLLGDQLDNAIGGWIAASSLSKSIPAFTPVANGALKTLSVMVGESASDQLDNVMRGQNPFEGIGLSYATNFGVGLGLALAPGIPWAMRKAKILANADNQFGKSLGQTFTSYRNDPNMTDEQRTEAFMTIRNGLVSERAKVLADRLWALSGVNETDSPQTHSVLKQAAADAEKNSVEAELDAANNKKAGTEILQSEKDKVIGTTGTVPGAEGQILPGIPVTPEQEKAELERFKNFFQTGGKEYKIQNTPENADKIKWLESKGAIYGNLTDNDEYYVVKGVRMGEGDLAKWYGEDDPKERFQNEKFELGKEISKAHKGTDAELNQKVDELDNASTYEDLRRLAMKFNVPLSEYEKAMERSNMSKHDRVEEDLALNRRLQKLNDNLVAMKKLRDETPEEERFALDEGIAKVEAEIQRVSNQKQSEGQDNFDKNVRDMENQADSENQNKAKSGELAKELKDNPEVILAILNPKNASNRQYQMSQPSPIEEDKEKLGEAFNLEDDRVVANLKRIGALDEAGRPLMSPAETIIAYINDKLNYLNGRSLSGYRQYNVADQVYQGFVSKALLEIRKGNKISLSTIFNSQLYDFIRKAKARMGAGVGLGAMGQLKEEIRKVDPQSLIDELGMDENQAELVKNTFDQIEATEAEWQAAQPGAVPTPTLQERIEAMAVIASEIAPALRQTLKSDIERLAFDSLLNSKIMANLDALARQLGSTVTDVKLIQNNIQNNLIEAIKSEYRKRLSEDNLPSIPSPAGEVKKAGTLTDQQIRPTLSFYSRAISETLLTDAEAEEYDRRRDEIQSGRRVEDLRSFQEDLISLIDDKLGIDENGNYDPSVLDEFVNDIAGVEGDENQPGNLRKALASGIITKAQQAKLLSELIAAEEKATRLINEAKDKKQLRAAAREYRATLVRVNDQLMPKQGGESEKPKTKIQEPKPSEGGKTVAKLTPDQRKEARRLAKEKQAAPKPGEGKQPGKPGEAPGGTTLGRRVSGVLQRISAAILPKKYTDPRGAGVVPYDEQAVKNLGSDIYDNLTPEQRQDVAAALASMEGSKNKSFYLANGAGTGKTRVLLAVAKHYMNMGKKVLYLTAHDAVTPNWATRTIGGTIQKDALELGIPVIAYGGKASGIDNLKAMPEGVMTVSTYNSNYLPKFLSMIDKDTVVLFDEHHNGRNLFSAKQEGGSTSAWPVLMEKIADKAGSVMMASGTPFDRPDQLLSLKRLGIFDTIHPEQLLKDLGFEKYEIPNSKKYYWDLAQGVSLNEMQARLEKYIDKLALTGIFRSRSLKLDGINVEFKNVALDKTIKTELDDIANRYGGDGNQSMQARMKAVTAQKRALEKFKVNSAARQAVDAIKRGVKPIVYVGFVSEKDTQGNDVDQISLQVEQAIAKLIAEEMPQLSATLSIARLYSKGDPKDVAIDKFNNQGANVLIATTAMGGTGIELDDKAGNQPREMIIMSPPISAIAAVQLIYRVWRADSASRPNIVFLTADHQVDQEPLDRMRQKIRLLDAVMGAGFEGLKGEKVEQIQTTVANDPAKVKAVEESLTRGFKADYKNGVLTLRDPKTGATMTYNVMFNSGIDGAAHADYGLTDSDDKIVLNPEMLAQVQQTLGDKFDLWAQAMMIEEAIHLETVRLWRAEGKNIEQELAKVANGMSKATRRAHARLYFATQGYDLNKPEVQLKINALAADDLLIAFEAIRQIAQFNLTGKLSEELGVVTEADVSRVRAIAKDTLASDTDKNMFETIASYLGNMITALKTKFGITTEVRLSLREAIQESIARLSKTQAEYSKLAEQVQPQAAPFQGSPTQPVSLGTFGTYDLRVNRLIESHLDNQSDGVLGVTADNDLFRTVDREDWLFALDQAAKNGIITDVEKTLYRAASLDSLINGRVALALVPVKAIEIGEAMETGMLEGTRGAVAIPQEAFVPIQTVQDTPVTDSKIQGKEMYRFILRGYPSEKTFADTLDQALSRGAVKLLANREKVIYEGKEYTYNSRGALIKELQRRGANNFVSKVKITPKSTLPFVPEVAISNAGSTGDPTKNGMDIKLGVNMAQIIKLLGPAMYSKPLLETAVKELVQNSFDAVRSAGFTEENPGNIEIIFDEDKRQLTVTDNGIGMTPEVIQKAFFTIGGTHKEGSPQNTSGGLGLAKMAFILGSEDISITTVKDGVQSKLKATSQEIQNGIIKVDTKKTNDRNGTSVTITVPKTITDANGEQKEQRFSTYQPFLEKPLLGPVIVQTKFKSGGRIIDSADLPIGIYQKDFQFETAFKFDWGTINMYIDPKRTEYPSIHALSAGLFQFGIQPYEIFGFGDSSRSLPYNIVLDVRPSVRADNPAYPFNLQREGWRGTVSEDIQAMYGYLKQFAAQQSLLQAKESMQGIEKLPSLDITKDIPEKELARLAEEKARTRQISPTSVSNKVVAVDFSKALDELKKISLIFEDNTIVKQDRNKYVEKSFEPEKAIEIPTMDVSEFNVNEPLYVNNTNYEATAEDKAFFTELSNTFLYLMRDLGTKVSQENPSDKLAQLADKTPTGWFAGVSLDKNYRGLNMIKPFQSIWLNPALLSDIALKFPSSAAAETLHIMLHEITHVDQRNEGAGFTAALATLDAKLDAYNVDIALVELKLKQIYEKYWNAVQSLNNKFGSYNTKNRAESFKSSAALGVEQARAKAASQGIPIVDVEGAVRIPGQGPGGDLGTQKADSGIGLGDVLSAKLKNGAFKFPQTPIIAQPGVSEPRMVESQAMKNLVEKYGDNFPDVTFKEKFLGELYNVSVSMDQQFEDARQYIEENGGWREAVVHYLSNSMNTSLPIQAAVGFELLRTLGPLAKTDKYAREVMAKVMLVQKQRYGTDPGRTVQLWSALSEMADNPEAMRLFVHGELAQIAAGRLEPYKEDIDNVRNALKDAGRIAADRVATSPELESTIDKIAKLIDKNRKEQNFEGIDRGMFDFVNSEAAKSLGDAFLGAIAVKPKAAEVPGSDADEIRLAPERIKNLGTLIAQIINSSENPDALQADPEALRSLVYLTPSLRNNPNQGEVRRLVELYFDAAYSYSLAIREAAEKGIEIAPAPSITKREAAQRVEQDKIKAQDKAPIQISSDIQDELSTYAPAAAEALERLSKKSQLPPAQKEFVEEFARLLRSDMTAMIKQAGGLQPKFEKPTPPTGAEILRDRIMNIDSVRSFIAEVQEILMEKYKGRESELVGVWPYIENAWEVPFSLTSFSKTIKSLASIGGPKVNVRDLIRSSQGDIEAFENMLGELLTKNTNLDQAQVKLVNDYLRKKMAEFLKDERTKELNRIKKRLEDRQAGKKARKQASTALTRLIEAANLGVLKDEQLFADLRTQLGLPEMTGEQLDHLNKMIDDLPNYPKGRVRNQKISKMYEYVKLLAPMTVTELLTNYQSMNLLLAFGTSGINAFSSLANNIAQAAIIGARGAIKTVTGTVFNKPQETIRGIGYMKAALETFKPLAWWNKNGGQAWKAAKEIFLKGDFSNVQSVTTMEMGGINMFEAFTSQLDAYLKKHPGAVKPEITIKTPGFLEWVGMQPEYTFSLANKYAFSKFNPATVGPFILFGRLMAIGDAMNTMSAKKMYQTGEAYNIALKKGFTTLEEVEKEVARLLNSTPEARRRAEARAREESKELNYTPYQYALRVEEIIEQERPQDEVSQELLKRTEKFAERSNFRNNFEGVLGAAAASAVTLSNIFPPAKYVLKYLRTGASLGNAALDVVPILGTFRYFNGVGNFEVMRKSKFYVPPAQKDTVDRDIALGKMWLSYLIGLGLLNLLRQALSREPDPEVNIHISGPKDPAQRKAFYAGGGKNKSIQIGKFEDGNPRFISFESLPPFLAGILIPIGAFTEAIRYEKRSVQEAIIPTIAAASWMTIYSMLDYAFLSGIRGLIQLAAPSNGSATATDQLTNIVKFSGNVASTLVPGYASLRDIEKLVEGIYGLPTGRLYQDSFMSVFLASVPFASKIGEPSLDFLGGTSRAKFWNSVPFVRRLMTTGVDTSEYAQGIRTDDAIHDKLISLFAKNQTALDWEAGPLKVFAAAELANKPTVGISEILALKRELTENEKYEWMKRAYPYILQSLGGNIESLQSLQPEEFKYVVGELARPFMKLALYETLAEKNQQGIIQELSPEATNVLPTETK